MDYLLHILILIGIYGIAASSLNLIAGHAGFPSLAHGAFFGIGAYVAAILSLRLGLPAWATLPAAMLVTGAVGGVVAVLVVPIGRARDDVFVLTTFCLQVIAVGLFTNWVTLTGGPFGLTGIPRPVVLGVAFTDQASYCLLVWALAISTFVFLHRVLYSPFGRVLRGIRDDETFTVSLGKSVGPTKVIVFFLSSMLVGMAGALYAWYISFIDPTSFTLEESVFILSMVIVGGAGSVRGPLLGAAVLVALPELLRFIGLPGKSVGNIRQITYGTLLVVMMLWCPQGLQGDYDFERTE